MTDRRAFLAALGLSLLAAPVAGRAQQPGTAQIGVLLFSTPAVDPNVPVFREAMRDLGWVEGRNLALEYRYAEGRAERLPEVAAELVRLKRLPLATGWGAWAEGGALLAYGPNINDIVRRSARHADRILKGAKPADLPVEQPTRFELVVNRKTAQALGLTPPPTLLLRADRVIQ